MHKLVFLSCCLATCATSRAVYFGNDLIARSTQDGSAFVLVTTLAQTPSSGIVESVQFYAHSQVGTVDLVLLTPVSGSTYTVDKRETVAWIGTGLQTYNVNWAAPAGSIVAYHGQGPAFDFTATAENGIYYNANSPFFPPQGSTFDTNSYVYSGNRTYSFGYNFRESGGGTPSIPGPAAALPMVCGIATMLRRRRA
jgi:hypothetical protein